MHEFLESGGKVEFGTVKAAQQARDLNYQFDDVRALLAALGPEHFHNASWCKTSGQRPDYVFACDAYVVPFVRLRRIVVPGWDPKIFVKFGFSNFDDARISITSFHEEKS